MIYLLSLFLHFAFIKLFGHSQTFLQYFKVILNVAFSSSSPVLCANYKKHKRIGKHVTLITWKILIFQTQHPQFVTQAFCFYSQIYSLQAQD